MYVNPRQVDRWIAATIMQPRPDWNCRGPRLPAWFRPALRRVNPLLVPQFMPPNHSYPHGVWAICKRPSRNSRLMWKRWHWSLSDSFGRYQPPGRDTIDLLRMAEKMYRAGRGPELEDAFMESLDGLNKADGERSREQFARRVQAICRKHDELFKSNHFFVRDSPLAA